MAFRTGLLGKKLGMTSVFTADGDRSPVTAIHAGPVLVVDKLHAGQARLRRRQLGFDEKPLAPHEEAGARPVQARPASTPQRFVREVRLEAGRSREVRGRPARARWRRSSRRCASSTSRAPRRARATRAS